MLVALSLRSFRNLDDCEWRPGPGRHLLLGANGAGKTSLMEAVYLLATTRSFRTSSLGDCCRHGASGFQLEGEAGARGRTRLEFGWSGGDGRTRRVNGRTGSLAEHLAVMPVVAWTSAHGELLGGPPEVRRRFVDQGVIGLRPGALEVFGRYRRALEQKRELLARGGGALEPWNRVLAVAAAEIAGLRESYLEELARALRRVSSESGLELPPVELRYRPSPPEATDGETALRTALERLAAEERRQGRPLAGPHRDGIDILWGGRRARETASAGESKSLCLALLAAGGRILEHRGRPPVYLLDDLDSELDEHRLTSVRRLFDGAGQIFITSNRSELWRGQEALSRWRLEGGSPRLAGGP